MVCSFGDQNDVAVFRELGLPPFQAIDLEGNITEIGGPLAGMPVIDARTKAIGILEKAGRIENIVEHDQEIPISERGKNPIEIILLKEWYVRQTHIQDRMRELANEINFVPPRNKQFLLDWMENITIDWPVSITIHARLWLIFLQCGNIWEVLKMSRSSTLLASGSI